MPHLPSIAPNLLQWFNQNHRVLPFREDPTPYHIWVSEIMLQQTRVSAALPFYNRFITELPTIESLAQCNEEKLHKLWQGLGYYNRVRNLQKAAKIVVQEYQGQLPANYAALKKLPGIGDYTAGAIASIAFNLPEIAVDGNVLRVFSRLLASKADISKPQTKKELSLVVKAQQPEKFPGDYNQAIMELGALICTPGTPNCNACPLQNFCLANKQGIAETLPIKASTKPQTISNICVMVLHQADKTVLFQRPKKGLLAGLWGPFTLEGSFTQAQALQAIRKIFPSANITGTLPNSQHVFTHRIWQMYGWQCQIEPSTIISASNSVMATFEEITQHYSIPTAFKAYLPYLTKQL